MDKIERGRIGKKEFFLTGKALLYILYRILGTILHVLLPLVKLLVPDWAIEQRLGRYKSIERSGPLIWIHVASVGEVQAARALIAALTDKIPDCNFFLTTMTRQGRIAAQSRLLTDVRCELAPLDTPLAVSRAIQTVQPDIYICLETELWPMMMMEIGRAGIPMLLL
ncbi:MAG: hypothetical protein D3923_08950, partial [Candidatus Electrothrix sp. AR3]|nr:hypothetical protein [Candidatus Electrothrix sp. AR3]